MKITKQSGEKKDSLFMCDVDIFPGVNDAEEKNKSSQNAVYTIKRIKTTFKNRLIISQIQCNVK